MDKSKTFPPSTPSSIAPVVAKPPVVQSVPQPIVQPSSPAPKRAEKKKYTSDEFLTAFEELSVRMGWSLDTTPVFYKQDNGAFSIKVQIAIVPRK